MMKPASALVLTAKEKETGVLEPREVFRLPFLTVPEGIREISEHAFAGNGYIVGVCLPSSLRTIRGRAFAGCDNLRHVLGGENTEAIGDRAFAGCSGLQEIPVFGHLVSLGSFAFSRCAHLGEVRLPDSLEEMGRLPFLDSGVRRYAGPEKFCRTPGRLGLPDEKGFVVEKDTLIRYSGDAVTVRVPPGVRKIQAGAFDAVPASGDRRVTICLPPDLKRLEYSDGFSHCDVTLPEGFLRQPVLLSPSLLPLLKGNWEGQLRPLDLASLFLFQKGNLRREAARQLPDGRYALYAAQTGGLFLQLLTETRLTAQQRRRAFLCAVQWYFVHAAKLPEDYAQSLGRTAGEHVSGRYPERFVDLVLAAHHVGTDDPGSGAFEKIRPGTGSRAKRAVALYLALGEYCEHLTDEMPFLLPDAEEDAVFLQKTEWNMLLDALFPEAVLARNRVHLYPFLRFSGDPAKVKRLLGSLFDRDDRKKMKPLFLSDTDAVLEAMVSTGVTDGEILHDYLQTLAPLGREHALCFPEQFRLNAKGERAFRLPDGAPWVTVFYRQGEFRLRNDRTGRPCRQIPVLTDAACMAEASGAIYEIKDYLKDLRTWTAHDQERSFLLGTTLDAGAWQRVYADPCLQDLGRGIVWEQNGRLFLWDGQFARSPKGRRLRLGNQPVRVAHPFDMPEADRTVWKETLQKTEDRPSFSQFGEPVYEAADIRRDRYAGCRIPADYLRHLPYKLMERLHIRGWDFDLALGTGAVLQGTIREPLLNSQIELGMITVSALDRTANHLLYLFDLWTLEARIKRDDVSAFQVFYCLDGEKQQKMLELAIAHRAVRVTAAFLEALQDKRDTEEFSLDEEIWG